MSSESENTHRKRVVDEEYLETGEDMKGKEIENNCSSNNSEYSIRGGCEVQLDPVKNMGYSDTYDKTCSESIGDLDLKDAAIQIARLQEQRFDKNKAILRKNAENQTLKGKLRTADGKIHTLESENRELRLKIGQLKLLVADGCMTPDYINLHQCVDDFGVV